MNFDLVITNGIVVTSSGILHPQNSDIAVIDGIITHVGRGLTATAGRDTRIVDGEGAHVTPGGVDTHVHLSQGTRFFQSILLFP
ncbi:hypothetical protein V1527DRAFT_471500 [Lipomyces starkeyi]